jgi:hypothetical protein
MFDDEQSTGCIIGTVGCDHRGAVKVFLWRACEQAIGRSGRPIGPIGVIVVVPWPGQDWSTSRREQDQVRLVGAHSGIPCSACLTRAPGTSSTNDPDHDRHQHRTGHGRRDFGGTVSTATGAGAGVPVPLVAYCANEPFGGVPAAIVTGNASGSLSVTLALGASRCSYRWEINNSTQYMGAV